MLLLDILMTLVVFFISSFHGFLEEFRHHGDSSSNTILVLKIIAIAIFAIRMVMSFVTLDYEDDTFYLYVVDMIKK
jgi:uncharacterized membrane protein